jgi:hypothetical protein
MFAMIDCTNAPFVRCGKQWKVSPDSGDSGSKKCKRGYGGIWRSLRLARVWIQTVGFVLVRLAGFSHHEDVFTFFFLLTEML